MHITLFLIFCKRKAYGLNCWFFELLSGSILKFRCCKKNSCFTLTPRFLPLMTRLELMTYHSLFRYGDIKEVKQALRCRLSPNKVGLYKWTPLHEAASNGYNDIVKMLLQHGGKHDSRDALNASTSK